MRQNQETVRRPRGRPQTRSDEDTLLLVVDAAEREFQLNGYAGANIKAVAQRAGISTVGIGEAEPVHVAAPVGLRVAGS